MRGKQIDWTSLLKEFFACQWCGSNMNNSFFEKKCLKENRTPWTTEQNRTEQKWIISLTKTSRNDQGYVNVSFKKVHS